MGEYLYGENMKEKKFIVYEHLFPNGKRYFGITSKLPKCRWESGSGYDKDHQPVMYNAIQKYGWDNIQHNIIAENLSYSEAITMEMSLIAKYKTNCKRYGYEYGYNMTDGGEGTLGHVVSQESREKMSKARMGKYKGKDCYKSKPTLCDGIEYESLTECIKVNNIKGAVNEWLLGNAAMPIEWYKRGLRFKDQQHEIKVQKVPKQYKVMYDNKIYNSQKELAMVINVAPPTISCWLNGKRKIPKEIKEKGLRRIN